MDSGSVGDLRAEVRAVARRAAHRPHAAAHRPCASQWAPISVF